jgi:two-component system response regulator DegU
MPRDRIRVLIADDHPIFLEGLCTLLSMKFPEIEVVAAVSNGGEAVEKVHVLNPDIVLMDIRMPDMDGIEATRQMRENHSDLKIIMLTTFDERNLVEDSLASGASGYILKETSVDELVSYIKIVHAGNVLMTERATQIIKVNPGAEIKRAISESSELGPDERRQLSLLKKRELDVLSLLIAGRSNKMIADTLFVSEHTVRNYVSRIYHTIGVHDRFSLMSWARERHLVE